MSLRALGKEILIVRSTLPAFESLEGRCLLSADLTVSIVSPSSGGSLVTGVESTVLVLISNSGSTDVRDRFGVAIYASADGTLDADDALIGLRRRSGASAGESETKDIEFTLPNSFASGEYTLFARVDSGGAIEESDETNNVSDGVRVTIGPRDSGSGADLVVTITAPADGASLTLGREHRVIVSAANQGDARTSTRAGVRLYASRDAILDMSADSLLAARTISSLSAGESEQEDLEFILPTSLGEGEFFLIAVIDAASIVPETVEGNNTSAPVAVRFTGTPAPGSQADLSVTVSLGGDDTLSRSTLEEVLVTVVNSGATGTRTRFGVTLYASSDSTLDTSSDMFLGAQVFKKLAAGATDTEEMQFIVPGGLAEGEYTIYAVVDGLNVVPESNESNNTSPGVVVTVETASLDLAGNITRLTLDDAIVTGVRERGHVKLDFTNLGDDQFIPGQKVHIRAYLRPEGAVDGSGDIAISREVQHSLARLSNDRPKNVSFALEVPASAAAGDYRLFVKLDSANEIAESNELNNMLFADGLFVIAAPFVDLAISGSASLHGSPVRTTIRGAYSLNNLGNVSARGQTTVEFVLVNGEGVETILTPTVTKRVSLAAGRSSSQSRATYALPTGLSGTYSVLARLVGVSGFTETVTANNTATVGTITIG